VGEGLILETSFLVDLEREAIVGEPGRAHAFLEAHPDRRLSITSVTAGELACGPRVEQREAWERLVGHFPVRTPDAEAWWIYGRTFRYLRDNGMLIGANDLWIAAVALAADLPLVTRDEAHFGRVPGLRLVAY
jgi:tRNA(fMet)-specific endonuclease VapC